MSDSISKLIQNHLLFKKEFFQENTEKRKLFKELSKGQTPEICVIACSDSRVDPAIITNSKPGELFVIRNVANIVPPCEYGDNGYHGTSAAIEFAVSFLKVKHIILLGHTECGGIASLFNDEDKYKNNQNFIDKWMAVAKESKYKIMHDHINESTEHKIKMCMQMSILNSLSNLLTFPFVKDAVNAGTLNINCWYFDLQDGTIYQLDKKTNMFSVLS